MMALIFTPSANTTQKGCSLKSFPSHLLLLGLLSDKKGRDFQGFWTQTEMDQWKAYLDPTGIAEGNRVAKWEESLVPNFPHRWAERGVVNSKCFVVAVGNKTYRHSCRIHPKLQTLNSVIFNLWLPSTC